MCVCERMDETHLSVFHSISNRTCGKRSRDNNFSTAWQAFNSFSFFKVRARDCTTFTLHDLADFYIESVTAHRIKRNDHSCFHNRWPKSKTKLKLKTSLRARGPPGVSGALRSLRILRIGRIGSGPRDCSQPPWMWPQEENCCQIEETDNTNGNQRAQNNFQRD